jgi:acetyl-CoA carboxylase biotin carboxyl carrier protein
MPLSYKDIADIVTMIDASELDELVIEFPDIKLAVRRRGAGENPDAAPIPCPSPPAATPAPAPRAALAPPARTDGAIEIGAPMIGTFHRSPSPKDPPFVEVGDTVEPGQPLGLIEVMKRHTTVEAKHAGRIADISAVSGALVEYDQLLFVIVPV